MAKNFVHFLFLNTKKDTETASRNNFDAFFLIVYGKIFSHFRPLKAARPTLPHSYSSLSRILTNLRTQLRRTHFLNVNQDIKRFT